MEQKIDLKTLRKHRGWTQSECGEFFGVDISTVWRWENWGVPDSGVSRKAIEREWFNAFPDEPVQDGDVPA